MRSRVRTHMYSPVLPLLLFLLLHSLDLFTVRQPLCSLFPLLPLFLLASLLSALPTSALSLLCGRLNEKELTARMTSIRFAFVRDIRVRGGRHVPGTLGSVLDRFERFDRGGQGRGKRGERVSARGRWRESLSARGRG